MLVARGFTGDLERLGKLVAEGARRQGFSFIDISKVCVSFKPSRSFKRYQDRVYNLEDEGRDPTDHTKALETVFGNDGRFPTALLYRGSAQSRRQCGTLRTSMSLN